MIGSLLILLWSFQRFLHSIKEQLSGALCTFLLKNYFTRQYFYTTNLIRSMLLVFRCFRNYVTKSTPHSHQIIKYHKNGLLNGFQLLPSLNTNSLTKNWDICIPIFRHFNSIRYLYNCRLSYNLFDYFKRCLINSKINEITTVTPSTEMVFRKRRTNIFKKFVLKSINKKKKSRKRKKMNNNNFNFQTIFHFPLLTGNSTNSIAPIHPNYYWVANPTQFNVSETETQTPTLNYSDVVKSDTTRHFEGEELNKFYRNVRQEIQTPYGQWMRKGWIDQRAKSGVVIKVVSYNILAQSLLEMHRELYKNHDTHYLSWEYRSAALLEEFKQFDADVLCLQEVEVEKLDFFNSELKKLGKSHDIENEPDYLTDMVVFREYVTVEYYQPSINILNRDNIGIVARFSPANNPNRNLIVATTHLLFNPRRHDIKLAQMQIMLAEIDRVAFKSRQARDGHHYYPIILTGDFNLQPHTFVYNLLEYGVLNHIGDSYKHPRIGFRRELIPSDLGITDNCQHDDVVRNRNLVRSEISDFKFVKLFNSDRRSLVSPETSWRRRDNFNYNKFGSGTLRYYLDLTSVYPHPGQDQTSVTTCQDEWCNVDYIFYGPTKKTRSGTYDGELKLMSYLRLPNISEAKVLRTIPNAACASDHLPLMATFHLPCEVK